MRWKQRPPGSNWGDFGPDDQRGRMNWVTREKVLQGIAEVKEGLTFSLSLPLDYPGGSVLNPRRNPPRLAATLRNGKQNFCFPLDSEQPGLTDVVSDDVALLTLQYSTQWDSFAHVGSRFDADGDGKREIVFYNGFRAGDELRPAPGDPVGVVPVPPRHERVRRPGQHGEEPALGIERPAQTEKPVMPPRSADALGASHPNDAVAGDAVRANDCGSEPLPGQ